MNKEDIIKKLSEIKATQEGKIIEAIINKAIEETMSANFDISSPKQREISAFILEENIKKYLMYRREHIPIIHIPATMTTDDTCKYFFFTLIIQ